MSPLGFLIPFAGGLLLGAAAMWVRFNTGRVEGWLDPRHMGRVHDLPVSRDALRLAQQPCVIPPHSEPRHVSIVRPDKGA